jgi:hypothetical protein
VIIVDLDDPWVNAPIIPSYNHEIASKILEIASKMLNHLTDLPTEPRKNPDSTLAASRS